MNEFRTTVITFDPFLRMPGIKGKSDAAIGRLISIDTGTVEKMRKREDVPFDTIWKICHVMECQPGDIMEAETIYITLANE